jgi:hypothetical protein
LKNRVIKGDMEAAKSSFEKMAREFEEHFIM